MLGKWHHHKPNKGNAWMWICLRVKKRDDKECAMINGEVWFMYLYDIITANCPVHKWAVWSLSRSFSWPTLTDDLQTQMGRIVSRLSRNYIKSLRPLVGNVKIISYRSNNHVHNLLTFFCQGFQRSVSVLWKHLVYVIHSVLVKRTTIINPNCDKIHMTFMI